MKKLIMKVKEDLPYSEIERLEATIKNDLEKNGFAIVDDRVDIYEIETGEDDK